ncbi:MAG: UvrB/UvrC motif-containing protein [Clostridia bacterium]|nr:UvrB/UvrC motif-containing protein [Clostridia bacterium]
MLCQNCQKRIANVHFTQIINNKKVEMFLCDQCSKEKGQIGFETTFNINDFLSGFMSLTHPVPNVNTVNNDVVCNQCGMSYVEFQKVGKFGCGNCYDVFGERVKPLIKRLHGNVQHHGKEPSKFSKSMEKTREIETLKQMLNAAVQNEEYEKAADIRDKIREIEVGG